MPRTFPRPVGSLPTSVGVRGLNDSVEKSGGRLMAGPVMAGGDAFTKRVPLPRPALPRYLLHLPLAQISLRLSTHQLIPSRQSPSCLNH